MAIYVKFAEEKKPKSIKEFLTKFFSEDDGTGYVRNVESYNNKECTSVQCVRNKYRSFDDTLELVQTYYKSSTPKKVFETLLNLKVLNGNNSECYLHMMSCSGIRRINFLYIAGKTGSAKTDYKSICYSDTYNSKYSWQQLFAMLNINSNEDFTKYLKENER